MGRLAVLLLPLIASCTYASAPADDSFDGTEGVGITTRILYPASEYDTPGPTATAGAISTDGLAESFDLRARTFHTLPKPPSAPPPEAPPERTAEQQERAVIYTGSLSLQVPDPEGLEVEAGAIARQHGGWVQKIERPRITVRVPAARFEEAMKAFSALGQVLDRKISGQDVTDQFRDLRIRLENAEKVRVRLAALLEQAKTVQDALAVEKELGRVTEEIERYKGQIAAMQDRIAFSTITLELRRSLPIALRHRRFPFPWVHRLGAEALLRF